jgi:hypothetical protein
LLQIRVNFGIAYFGGWKLHDSISRCFMFAAQQNGHPWKKTRSLGPFHFVAGNGWWQ